VLMTAAVTEWGCVSTGESRAGVCRRGLVLRSSEVCRVKCELCARGGGECGDGGVVEDGMLGLRWWSGAERLGWRLFWVGAPGCW
jgi:hypothetical protein